MEKKEVYICHQQCNINSEQINVKEFLMPILKYYKFILIFSFVITVLTILYVNKIQKVYQIESFISLGYFSTNNSKEYFIDPHNALILIKNKFTDNMPNLYGISLINGNKVLDLKINAYSNRDAKKYLEKIVEFLHSKEKNKLQLLIQTNKSQIKNLTIYKNSLKKQLDEYRKKLKLEKNAIIYQTLLENISNLNDKIFKINEKINFLKFEISPLNINKTHIMGKIIENKYPVKPKKKLIVIIVFISSFILSIFLVLFFEFINNLRKKEN